MKARNKKNKMIEKGKRRRKRGGVELETNGGTGVVVVAADIPALSKGSMRLRHVDAVLIEWCSLEIRASTRAIDRCPRVAAAAVGGIRGICPVAKVGRFRQTRGRATGRRKAIGCGRGYSVGRRQGMGSLRGRRANTKRILGEAQADATLDAVV